MGDLAGALAVYRKVIALDERALTLDPGFLRARRGLVINELKVGNVEIETDPAQALKDYEIAQERFDTLPEAKLDTLPALRLHANLLRKRATALRELAQFTQAAPLFDQALNIQRKIAAQDPKDSRSQFDVYVDLTQAAYDYEYAADPAFAGAPDARRRNMTESVSLLKQAESILVQLLKVNPANDQWKAGLADVQVRLGTAEQDLGNAEDSAALSAEGVATLKEMALKHPDTALTLDAEIDALLTARPVALRDAKLAVSGAEREATLTRRREPGVLLSLAQAYRAAGEIDAARSAAREGMALLPPAQPATPPSRTRMLLELQEK